MANKYTTDCPREGKVTCAAGNLVNGNISDVKVALKNFNKTELLNFIQEYSLLSGENIGDSVVRIKRLV